jgi:hypothetical protein
VLLFVLPGYTGNPDVANGLQVAFGLTAVIVAAGSQGALDRWFGRRALQARDRLLGPANRKINVPRGLTTETVGGAR